MLQKLVQEKHLRDPAVGGPTMDLKVQLYWMVRISADSGPAARGLRGISERRRGVVRIEYPEGRSVSVPRGWAVLDAGRRARIPHAAICGGRGRCTTCRVRVLRGMGGLPPPDRSEQAALARLRAGPNVRLACQLRPEADTAVLPLVPAGAPDDERRQRGTAAGDTERVVAILFVDIRKSTALVENRMPYDVVFLLNHFFEAVAGAVVEAGGMPNWSLGDGMMAIFGVDVDAQEACRQSLSAAQLIQRRLAKMNEFLKNELQEPISIGIGIHVGRVILGEIGYRDHFVLTAVGDFVHVAARLQDLTKEHHCLAVVSASVLATAGLNAEHFTRREVRVRGRDAPLGVILIADLQTFSLPLGRAGKPDAGGGLREPA